MPTIVLACPEWGGLGARSDVPPDPDGSVPYWALRCSRCGAGVYQRREGRSLLIALGLVATLVIAGWLAVFG